MTSAVDMEVLIQEIKNRPVIWDTNYQEYNMGNKRRAAWYAIGSYLIPYFNKKGDKVQKYIIQGLIFKWNAVRDTYINFQKEKIKQLQTGINTKAIPECAYYQQLTFLNKIIENNTTECYTNSTIDNIDSNSNTSIWNNTDDQQDISMSVPVECIQKRTEQFGNDFNMRKTMEVPDTSKSINATIATQPITLNITQATAISQSKPDEEDEDLAFFYSLLPFVKTLTATQKVSFRLQTTQLAQSIKTNSSPEDYPIVPAIHLHMSTNPKAYSQSTTQRENSHNVTSYIIS